MHVLWRLTFTKIIYIYECEYIICFHKEYVYTISELIVKNMPKIPKKIYSHQSINQIKKNHSLRSSKVCLRALEQLTEHLN